MIVQCDKCKTKFRIADAKVGENGVKVRCSRCANVFMVKSGRDSADLMAPVPQAPQTSNGELEQALFDAGLGPSSSPLPSFPDRQAPQRMPMGAIPAAQSQVAPLPQSMGMPPGMMNSAQQAPTFAGPGGSAPMNLYAQPGAMPSFPAQPSMNPYGQPGGMQPGGMQPGGMQPGGMQQYGTQPPSPIGQPTMPPYGMQSGGMGSVPPFAMPGATIPPFAAPPNMHNPPGFGPVTAMNALGGGQPNAMPGYGGMPGSQPGQLQQYSNTMPPQGVSQAGALGYVQSPGATGLPEISNFTPMVPQGYGQQPGFAANMIPEPPPLNLPPTTVGPGASREAMLALGFRPPPNDSSPDLGMAIGHPGAADPQTRSQELARALAFDHDPTGSYSGASSLIPQVQMPRATNVEEIGSAHARSQVSELSFSPDGGDAASMLFGSPPPLGTPNTGMFPRAGTNSNAGVPPPSASDPFDARFPDTSSGTFPPPPSIFGGESDGASRPILTDGSAASAFLEGPPSGDDPFANLDLRGDSGSTGGDDAFMSNSYQENVTDNAAVDISTIDPIEQARRIARLDIGKLPVSNALMSAKTRVASFGFVERESPLTATIVPRTVWPTWVGVGLGLVITLLAWFGPAGGDLSKLGPETIQALVTRSAPPIAAAISDVSVRSAHVTSYATGSGRPLLVVAGEAVNDGRDKLAGLEAVATILDGDNVVGRRQAWLGVTLGEDVLSSIDSPRELEAAYAQAVENLGETAHDLALTPGATLPFMVVFPELPQDLDRRVFTVEFRKGNKEASARRP